MKPEIRARKEEEIRVNMEKIPKEFHSLVDKSFCRLVLSLEVHGAPPEYANALVRSATTEQDGWSLDVRFESIRTDDLYVDPNRIIDNLKFIPLVYGLSEERVKDARLSMDITNTSTDTVPIFFSQIQTGLPFPLSYSTTVICYLQPGKRLQIEHIEILHGCGLAPGSAAETARFFPAHAYSIVPLELPPCTNNVVDLDKSVCISTPMSHRLRCEIGAVVPGTKGILNDLFGRGSLLLLWRLAQVQEVIRSRDPTRYVSVPGRVSLTMVETNTIAKLMDRAAVILYPDIGAVISQSSYPDDIMTVVIEDSRAEKIMEDVVSHLISVFEGISAQFAGAAASSALSIGANS